MLLTVATRPTRSDFPLDVETEGSALYVVARLRGLWAGMVCACSSNLVDGVSVYDNQKSKLEDGWMRSIEVALRVSAKSRGRPVNR